MITVSDLYIYPVKSLAGIRLESAELSRFGLKHDRRWMVVDKNGLFMSQRKTAKMATVKTSILNDQLYLSHQGSDCAVPLVDDQSRSMTVTVWRDTLEAKLVSDTVDKWLTEVLGQPCHLVYMEHDAKRQVNRDFAYDGQYVSFADGFPLLVISQASLDDLNARLSNPININRFRPNLVVSGTEAFAEDHWKRLSIRGTHLLAVKQCERCILPSINQQTGQKDQLKMLAQLNTYRKQNNKVMFGQNLIFKDVNQLNGQSIFCGDQIELYNE